MKLKHKIKLAILAGTLFVLTILTLTLFKIKTVHGNEVGVLESWSDGVAEQPLQPKTYFFFPGYSKTVTAYDVGPRVFVMNDKANGEEKGHGRERDSYQVQSSEGQDMHISLSVQWRVDPGKVVFLHKNGGAQGDIEERIIRPVVMRVVKDAATVRKAIDNYSGEGLVQLQAAIQTKLMDPTGELQQKGIIVENFVIEGVRLAPTYIDPILQRQVAVQEQQTAAEQTKAAEAKALKAKADAQADYNKQVVEAERDKQRAILKAEQEAESQVLAAKADAEKVKLAAEADKTKVTMAAQAKMEAGVNEAKAIEAIGAAEAEATKLKLSAYAVPGADAFVKVEISKNMGTAFSGIKGYLPSDMKVNLLSESFVKSVESLLGNASAVRAGK